MKKVMRRDPVLPLFAAALVLAIGAASSQAPRARTVLRLPGDARQLLLVVTADWNATAGVLRRFERPGAASAWTTVGAAVPVVVGRSGLAWGRGSLVGGQGGPIKKEGDGKSPAGAFGLGTAFGQTADAPSPLAVPYLYLDQDIECVDDSASAYYNHVMNRARAKNADWSSSEKMWQEPLYKLGVVVRYNQPPAARGAGSCIFLHIWKGPASSTAGCTAMAETNLVEIVKWLDAEKKPLLVQLPKEEWARLKKGLQLPDQPGA